LSLSGGGWEALWWQSGGGAQARQMYLGPAVR